VHSRQKARQHLQSFLLRHSRGFAGKSSWTRAHWAWLRGQRFDHPAQDMTFREYLHAIEQADARIDRITDALEQVSQESPQRATIEALQSLKGVRLVTAVCLVAELGDMTRFDSAAQLMAYVGLVPGERSSGETKRRTGITRTGNTHARRMLTESAWNYRYAPRVSAAIEARQRGQPEPVREIAFKAQMRLHTKFRRMTCKGKKSQ
jgi:transposase